MSDLPCPEEGKRGCLVIILLTATFSKHGLCAGTGLDAWSSLPLILANPQGLAKQALQMQKGPLGGQDTDLRPQPQGTGERVWKPRTPALVLPLSTQSLGPCPDLDTRGTTHLPFIHITLAVKYAFGVPTHTPPV